VLPAGPIAPTACVDEAYVARFPDDAESCCAPAFQASQWETTSWGSDKGGRLLHYWMECLDYWKPRACALYLFSESLAAIHFALESLFCTVLTFGAS
jgi:hypothetical protein